MLYSNSICDPSPSTSKISNDSTLSNDKPSPIFPSSPKFHNSDLNNDFGPPISPHVNVPNTHNFNQKPPPLPPRRERRRESSVELSQIRQAPDAPVLPPRDLSPPPLPPRRNVHSINHNYNDSSQHGLQVWEID